MDITEQLTHESRIALAAAAEIARLRAENERLRADAERWRYINDHNGEWRRFEADGPDPAYSMLCVRLPYDADLSCKAMRENAVDAARAAQEGQT